jgi:putative oxidoreductase
MKNKIRYTKVQETSLLLLRLIVAAIFLYSSYAKWQYIATSPEMPAGMLYLIKFLIVVEPLGAIALLAGFLTRWAAAGLGIIMVGAIVMLKFSMGTAFFTSQAPGLDYNALILGACIALVAFGAGKWSVDAMRKK